MIANPHSRWIAKMYASKAGRDHLGLGSVLSDQVLRTLSPAINEISFLECYHRQERQN